MMRSLARALGVSILVAVTIYSIGMRLSCIDCTEMRHFVEWGYKAAIPLVIGIALCMWGYYDE